MMDCVQCIDHLLIHGFKYRNSIDNIVSGFDAFGMIRGGARIFVQLGHFGKWREEMGGDDDPAQALQNLRQGTKVNLGREQGNFRKFQLIAWKFLPSQIRHLPYLPTWLPCGSALGYDIKTIILTNIRAGTVLMVNIFNIDDQYDIDTKNH